MKEALQEIPKEKKVAESASERYKKALEAAEAIKSSAVEELKGQINSKIAELNVFGFDYSLMEAGRKPATTKKTRTPSDKSTTPCPTCNFVTNPPHDNRLKAHRDQGEHKKPLNEKQLTEAGLVKVA
jgi:hypothetical protein